MSKWLGRVRRAKAQGAQRTAACRGGGQAAKVVSLRDVPTRDIAMQHVNATVSDSVCTCGANHVVRIGKMDPFLGCRNYKECGSAPIFFWKDGHRTTLPNGGTLEGNDVVFYRDEFGEPIG